MGPRWGVDDMARKFVPMNRCGNYVTGLITTSSVQLEAEPGLRITEPNP